MEKIILVTGATSGFGKAIAEKFAVNGWNCIITGRRADRLMQLASTLQSEHEVKILPLVFDVQDKDAVFQELGNLPDEWQSIDVLVNNAGLCAGPRSIRCSIARWLGNNDRYQCKGLLYVSKAVLPYLVKKGSGHIINMGSLRRKKFTRMVTCIVHRSLRLKLSAKRSVDLLPYKIKWLHCIPALLTPSFPSCVLKAIMQKPRLYTPVTNRCMQLTLPTYVIIAPHFRPMFALTTL